MKVRSCSVLLLLLLLLLVAVPAPASAHGLGSEDPKRPVGEYLWLGFEHLLAGWDHLLFILAICLVAGSLWRATKLMSLFVLGHSITLALATFQEWQVSATLVDVVIALSVFTVALVGFRQKEPNWRLFGSGCLPLAWSTASAFPRGCRTLACPIVSWPSWSNFLTTSGS